MAAKHWSNRCTRRRTFPVVARKRRSPRKSVAPTLAVSGIARPISPKAKVFVGLSFNGPRKDNGQLRKPLLVITRKSVKVVV